MFPGICLTETNDPVGATPRQARPTRVVREPGHWPLVDWDAPGDLLRRPIPGLQRGTVTNPCQPAPAAVGRERRNGQRLFWRREDQFAGQSIPNSHDAIDMTQRQQLAVGSVRGAIRERIGVDVATEFLAKRRIPDFYAAIRAARSQPRPVRTEGER